MVWFFGRDGQTIRVETRFDSDSREYVLEVARPEQPPLTERFKDVDSFRGRLQMMEAELNAGAWSQTGSELLPPPWKGPFTN